MATNRQADMGGVGRNTTKPTLTTRPDYPTRTSAHDPKENRYFKWAYVEADNVTYRHHRCNPDRHVSRLYARQRTRHGHPKAIGAVARHLAETSFHILSSQQPSGPGSRAGVVEKGGTAA